MISTYLRRIQNRCIRVETEFLKRIIRGWQRRVFTQFKGCFEHFNGVELSQLYFIVPEKRLINAVLIDTNIKKTKIWVTLVTGIKVTIFVSCNFIFKARIFKFDQFW